MMTEKPILDYGESIKRGNAEREHQDALIARYGSVYNYMKGTKPQARKQQEQGQQDDQGRQ